MTMYVFGQLKGVAVGTQHEILVLKSTKAY
jgi:hypothetical protein